MRTSEFITETTSEQISEIHNYTKLDNILLKLCEMVVAGMKSKSDYGMVAAAILTPDNVMVSKLNRPASDGKRIHAERAAIMAYQSEHGDIPDGSIIITTLSPCNTNMSERHGDDCSDLIDNAGIKKVYCGYLDPTQNHGADDHRQFNLMETQNHSIRELCQAFADTFLDDSNGGKSK